MTGHYWMNEMPEMSARDIQEAQHRKSTKRSHTQFWKHSSTTQPSTGKSHTLVRIYKILVRNCNCNLKKSIKD